MMTVFNVCFWVGVAVTALNAILGLIFGIIDFGIDFDFDLDLGDFDLGLFLPLSPSMFFLFLIVFGGSGKVLYEPLSSMLWLDVIIALLIGFSVTAVINLLIVKPLRKISQKECASDNDFIGLNAKVSEKIFENEYGKITFYYDGNTISGPAKSSDGKEIGVNTEVFIERIEGKVYIVDVLEKGE